MTYGLNRYLAQQEEGERYADWCENQGLDADSTEALALYEQYLYDQAEYYAELQAEALMDRWDDDPSPYDGNYSEL